jgi:hypothetical protein
MDAGRWPTTCLRKLIAYVGLRDDYPFQQSCSSASLEGCTEARDTDVRGAGEASRRIEEKPVKLDLSLLRQRRCSHQALEDNADVLMQARCQQTAYEARSTSQKYPGHKRLPCLRRWTVGLTRVAVPAAPCRKAVDRDGAGRTRL